MDYDGIECQYDFKGASLKPSTIQYRQLSGHKQGAYGIDFGLENLAILHLNPFSLDVYNQGVLVTSINKRGYLNFEHYRPRTVANASSTDTVHETAELPPDDVDYVEDSVASPPPAVDDRQNRLEQGLWDEEFKSHRDDKPHGAFSNQFL